MDPVQKEIADLEAQLAKLRMPKIPLCFEKQLKAVSDMAMQTGMERDLVAALQAYGTKPMAGPEDAAKAGEVLRAAVWTTLYLTGDHTGTTAGPTARARSPYGPPVGGPRVPNEPPGTTPTNGAHAPWPTRGMLQVWNVRAPVQRLCNSILHPKTAHHANAASTGHTVATGHASTTGPHGPGISCPPPPPYRGVHTGGGPNHLHGAHDGAAI